jgi:uncharacterized membrane protein
LFCCFSASLLFSATSVAFAASIAFAVSVVLAFCSFVILLVIAILCYHLLFSIAPLLVYCLPICHLACNLYTCRCTHAGWQRAGGRSFVILLAISTFVGVLCKMTERRSSSILPAISTFVGVLCKMTERRSSTILPAISTFVGVPCRMEKGRYLTTLYSLLLIFANSSLPRTVTNIQFDNPSTQQTSYLSVAQ